MKAVIPTKIIFIVFFFLIGSAEVIAQERMQLSQPILNKFANEYTLNIIKANYCEAPLISYMAA